MLLFFLFSCVTNNSQQLGYLTWYKVFKKREQSTKNTPTDLWWYIFWWLYPYGWIPLSRRQDCHLIEEFINPSDQIIAIFSFVGHIMKNLEKSNCGGSIKGCTSDSNLDQVLMLHCMCKPQHSHCMCHPHDSYTYFTDSWTFECRMSARHIHTYVFGLTKLHTNVQSMPYKQSQSQGQDTQTQDLLTMK